MRRDTADEAPNLAAAAGKSCHVLVGSRRLMELFGISLPEQVQNDLQQLQMQKMFSPF